MSVHASRHAIQRPINPRAILRVGQFHGKYRHRPFDNPLAWIKHVLTPGEINKQIRKQADRMRTFTDRQLAAELQREP